MTGRTINVKNAAELSKAMRTSVGGDTILLASGNYGNAAFNNFNPKGTVTIQSANPDADAVFETMRITRSSNLNFVDIDVHHPLAAGEADFSAAVRLTSARDIAFVGVDFSGSLNNNPHDDGNGFWAQGSERIAVLDSTFREFNVAAIFPKTSELIFAGNTIDTVREGINLSEVDGALVERNFITRVLPDESKGDHPDAIQVHAGGSAGSSANITIRSNVLKLADSDAQGIFIRNEKAKSGALHENITVEDNYYEGNSRHGITVSDTTDVLVAGNTVRDAGTMGLAPAININNVRGGVIENNIAPMLLTSSSTPNSNVTWSDNIDVWDRKQLKGVSEDALFSTAVGSKDIDFSALNVRGGSAAASQGIGFAAIEGIGDLKASASAVMAAYLPQFDHHSSHPVLV